MNFPWFISIYLSARPVSTNRFIDKYFCQYSPRYSPFSTSCKVFFNVYGIAIKYKFWNAHLNCLEIEICFLFNRGIFEPYKSFFPSKLGKFVGLKYDDYKYTYNIVCILWDILCESFAKWISEHERVYSFRRNTLLTDLLLTYCMANSRKIQQFNNLYTKYLRKLMYLFTLPLEHGEYEIFIYTRNKCMDVWYRMAATCNADVLRGIL